jgi:hypothetical protein
MRYEELSLPLAGGLFQIRFHQHVTVLAGLSGRDRGALIDAIANAAAGQVPDGRLVYRDRSGRRIVVRDGQMSYLDDGSDAGPALLGMNADAREMRNLLYVGAEELGLPRPLDDPAGLALQTELLAAREELLRTRNEVASASELRSRRERILSELEKTEATLADLGTNADRYLHNRARTLVELEQVRSALGAVEASTIERARDARLLAATDEVHGLADEWSVTVERLDQLLVRFRDRPKLSSDELAHLVDIPDAIPAGLAQAIADYESASARCDELETDIERLAKAPRSPAPSDTRVMVLATLDQDTLWMAHRRAVLAFEALAAARDEEKRSSVFDPAVRESIEAAHIGATESRARAERLWLPGILISTTMVCLAALLQIAALLDLVAPLLLLVAVFSLVTMVLIPRARAHQAERAETAALSEAGAADIHEYRSRFDENPRSARWARADLIVEDYESAMEHWSSLVGNMTVDEVGELEDQIHDWTSAQDPSRRSASVDAARRSLRHAQADLESSARRLATLLVPFGLQLEDLPMAIGPMIHERIQQGQFARLQIELGEAEEAERKITHRLEQYLASIGFEDGTLEARIGAYGWAIDGARQREHLRTEAAPHDELIALRDRLESRLSTPAPPPPSLGDASAPDEGPHVTELRQRRDLLRREAGAISLPDEQNLHRRLAKLESRVRNLEAEISPEAGLLAARPVDHLVETLVRYRPIWPPSVGDSVPAILDDPFGATPPQLRLQLLEALTEVAKETQVVLLTDDAHVADWARRGAARGALSLLEPISEAV